MISAAAQDILDKLQQRVNELKAAFDDATDSYNAMVADYNAQQAQLAYDVAAGNMTQGTYNDAILRITAVGNKRDNQKNLVAQAKTAYQDAIDEYQRQLVNLTTPEERQAILQEQQAQAALAKSESDNKIFMQKNTQYVIIGAIVLTVIGIAIYFMGRNAKP